MYGTTTDRETKESMQALRNLGVAKVVIEFSGGNDEGGADGADFFDAEGNKVDVPSGNAHRDERYNPDTKRFEPQGWTVSQYVDGKYASRPADEEEIRFSVIHRAIEAPIYDRWGSFAGEFYVQGTLTWDVTTGKNLLNGQESHEVWEDFDE